MAAHPDLRRAWDDLESDLDREGLILTADDRELIDRLRTGPMRETDVHDITYLMLSLLKQARKSNADKAAKAVRDALSDGSKM